MSLKQSLLQGEVASILSLARRLVDNLCVPEGSLLDLVADIVFLPKTRARSCDALSYLNIVISASRSMFENMRANRYEHAKFKKKLPEKPT